jgi:serine/threonine protein kinase
MGEVYRARDTRLDREVAIKVLPEFYSADPDRLRRFEVEARAAGRLNHPNVMAADGKGIYAREWRALPFEIFRVELDSGARTPWKRIAPADSAGAEDTPLVRLSSDGTVCAYSLFRKLSALYVMDGLR